MSLDPELGVHEKYSDSCVTLCVALSSQPHYNCAQVRSAEILTAQECDNLTKFVCYFEIASIVVTFGSRLCIDFVKHGVCFVQELPVIVVQ